MECIPVEERVNRFSQFYEGTLSEGPLVGFFHGTYYPLHRFPSAAGLPAGKLSPDDIDVQSFAEDYLSLYCRNLEHQGDFIWTAEAFYGIPWIEALCGARIIADHETGSSRAEPPEATLYEIPDIDTVSPWLEKAVEFLEMLKELSSGRFPLGSTLMRGLGDILNTMLGPSEMIYRMIDDPDRLAGLTACIRDRMILFADRQFNTIPDFHGGTGTHFYDLWLPGRGAVLQDDASSLLSPELYEKVIMPDFLRVIDHLDSAVVHLHPGNYMPIEPLLESPILALELHRDIGGRTVEELIPVYRKIQEKKPLVVWGDLSIDELVLLHKSVDMNRLAVKPVIYSTEQAEQIWKALKT